MNSDKFSISPSLEWQHATQITSAYPAPVIGPVVNLTQKQLDELKGEKEALRFDDNKTNWSLMPFEAVEEINKVLDFGAKKYAEWNWTNGGGMKHSRVINSCLRHLFAYLRGEDKDPESGLSHLAHAGCNILFLIYYNKHPEIFNKDDRHSKISN